MDAQSRVSDGFSIAHKGEIVVTRKGQFGMKGNGSKVSFPAGGEQAKLARPRDGLGAAFHTQLAIDTAGVPLDRVQCDDEPLSDLLVGETVVNETEHVAFAGGERFEESR